MSGELDGRDRGAPAHLPCGLSGWQGARVPGGGLGGGGSPPPGAGNIIVRQGRAVQLCSISELQITFSPISRFSHLSRLCCVGWVVYPDGGAAGDGQVDGARSLDPITVATLDSAALEH